jgi:4-hydroxybenzoate polyprenyltransferase|tara:strand:+ start:290 stop:1144 length:855 start_codon:yes stop_codon:yes gene_type:complete
MNKIKTFVELTRLNKPIGYMLLFWPCSWGLAFGLNSNISTEKFFYFLGLFFLGSILMRSAGCIFNDIIDKDLDKKVFRTKNRPIPSGKISVTKCFSYIVIICLFALLILIQFNKLTIFLGLASMILAFTYPFMKRITYWPQLFLGLTFNWGIIMAWVSLNNSISSEILTLYFSAIFWTLGYDTIYGAQDITDDEIIGIKSTSIKFKKNIKFFVGTCYLVSSSLVVFLFSKEVGLNIFTILITMFILSLIYQIQIFNKNNPKSCLFAFKVNNLSGLILFISIILI